MYHSTVHSITDNGGINVKSDDELYVYFNDQCTFQLPNSKIDLVVCLQLAMYFGAQSLVDTLLSVLCNYVRDGDLDLALNILHVVDTYDFKTLRKSCIDELANNFKTISLCDRKFVDNVKQQSLFDEMIRHSELHHK
jgi:hypothetical protein